MTNADILKALDVKIEQMTTAREALRKAFAGEVESGAMQRVVVSTIKPVSPSTGKKGRPMTEAAREHLREVWRLKKRQQTAAKKAAAGQGAKKTAKPVAPKVAR